MKISVVMATYNGESYIEEQLQSLLMQTHTIDEVIISDDCSTDSTINKINEFVKKNELNNWIVITNNTNRGWKINFREAIKCATGDLLFLCDQDDIWHNDKIEIMVRAMTENLNIILLASNITPIYEKDSVRVHISREGRLNDGVVKKLEFASSCIYIRHPGCSYCFRRKLIVFFDKYWFDDCPHDAFLWRTSALLDGLYYIRTSTIDFRRHGNNASDREHKSVETKIKNMEYYTKVLSQMKRFVENENVPDKNEKLMVLNRYNEWIILRQDFLKTYKIKWWIMLARYIDCFWSRKTYLADLFMVLGIYKRNIKHFMFGNREVKQ